MTRGRVFYGWWVTITFAVMVFLSTGVRFSVGPFLKPIVADLGTDRATYSLVVSLYGTRALLFAAMFLVHDSPLALLVISALGGASMSGSLAMTSALTADIFGRFSVGSVFGTIFVVHQGGAALGSWLGGPCSS
jgi:MFS family permease